MDGWAQFTVALLQPLCGIVKPTYQCLLLSIVLILITLIATKDCFSSYVNNAKWQRFAYVWVQLITIDTLSVRNLQPRIH